MKHYLNYSNIYISKNVIVLRDIYSKFQYGTLRDADFHFEMHSQICVQYTNSGNYFIDYICADVRVCIFMSLNCVIPYW